MNYCQTKAREKHKQKQTKMWSEILCSQTNFIHVLKENAFLHLSTFQINVKAFETNNFKIFVTVQKNGHERLQDNFATL